MEAPLQTCLLVGILWLVWSKGWKQFQLDRLRQDLFHVRGQLFDAVAMKQIQLGFDDKAYVLLRNYLNGSLRFCHKLDATLLICMIFFSRTSRTRSSDYRPGFYKLIDAIQDPATKKEMARLRDRATWITVRYLAYTSPLIFITMFFSVIGLFFTLVLTGAVKTLGVHIDQLASKAAERGALPLGAIQAEAEKCGNMEMAHAA